MALEFLGIGFNFNFYNNDLWMYLVLLERQKIIFVCNLFKGRGNVLSIKGIVLIIVLFLIFLVLLGKSTR